ncbi:DMT family transporter [Martelella alba]|uniref:DMT family transporter n=1 Tax=Martelella alba TaxID=2590451 RepID=A0A506UCT0_9HYPH|nr:DMT family transporter [Martelella alba]TPW31408.1 DMT family transporter [Martelella alba]
MSPSERTGAMQMLVAMATAGTVGLFVVFAHLPVVSIVFWRCILGGTILFGVCARLGYLTMAGLDRRRIVFMMLGGLAILGNWLFLFAAYARAPISVTATVYNTQPFMMVILGALFLGERLTASRIIWLAAGFAGVVVITGGPFTGAAVSQTYLIGVGFAFVSAFFYALSAIFTKALKGVPPHLIALVHMGLSALLLLPFVSWTVWPQTMLSWGSVAALGIIHTGLVYVLLYAGFQKLPTVISGALSFVYPVVAIIADALVFGHVFSAPQMLGAALIFISAAATTFGWPLIPARFRLHGRAANKLAKAD